MWLGIVSLREHHRKVITSYARPRLDANTSVVFYRLDFTAHTVPHPVAVGYGQDFLSGTCPSTFKKLSSLAEW